MKKTYILLHAAVLLAGFTGVFGKLISLNEVLLVFYRLLYSTIFLLVILKVLKFNTQISLNEKWSIAKSGLLITIHWIFFYGSIKYSNISIGVVCFCLTSFFTAFFKPLIYRQKFRITEVLLSTLTLVGISLIFHFDTSYRLGIVLGIVSSAFAALYTIYNEHLVKHYDTKLVNFYQMSGGTIFLGLLLPLYLYFFPSDSIIPDMKDTFYLIVLALFCTVGLYVTVSEVLKKIPAFTVNLTFNLEPIYAIIMAFLFFGESKEVNLSFYIGLLFIIISVVMQSVITLRQKVIVKT